MKKQNYLLHFLLFVAAFISCMIAGVVWSGRANPTELTNLYYGLEYAILIIFFLTAHEFGHYFAGKIYKLDTSLPYYIPLPPSGFFPISFGTMGAVIKMYSPFPSRKALFDIGAAGPLAGFVVCIGYLWWGYTHLPPKEFLTAIHPNYFTEPSHSILLIFGDTILMEIMKYLFTNPNDFIPPMSEIYHYPYLCAGWFGLFVTAMNLIPVGQLDGGHIIYSMVGEKLHYKIAKATWWFVFIAGISGAMLPIKELLELYNEYSIINFLSENFNILYFAIDSNAPFLLKGWLGWLLWAIMLRYVIKLHHPTVGDESSIGGFRMVLGLSIIIIFIISLPISGIYFK